MNTTTPLLGLRVLVIEDMYIISSFLEDMLADYGAIVAISNTTEKALAVIDAGGVDLALLDVTLDEDDTEVVAAALSDNDIPFAFHTGYDEVTWCKDYPKSPMITKPANETSIVAALTMALSLRAAS